MTTEAGSFDRTFSKVREFLRQSLKSTAAAVEILLVLQAGGAPADRLEGVKPPLVGGFRSFTPRAERARDAFGAIYPADTIYHFVM